MMKKLQRKHIFQNTSENFRKLFPRRRNKKTKKWKMFKVMLIFQNSENQVKLCEENLTKKNLYNSLKSMQKRQTPSNDGLTKEFYEMFWTELKEIFVDSVSKPKKKEW